MELSTFIDFIQEVLDPFVLFAIFVGIISLLISRFNGGNLLFLTSDGRELLRLSKILEHRYGFKEIKRFLQNRDDPSILLEGTFNGNRVRVEFWNCYIHETLNAALTQNVSDMFKGMSVVVYIKDNSAKKILKREKIDFNEILDVLKSLR
jgi:hypothetical protein